MTRYRKRPVVVDAMQWLPDSTTAAGELLAWLTVEGAAHRVPAGIGDPTAELDICTLEDGSDGRAKHVASPGDWIIRGVQGEFYACKPGIFAATYEPADAPDPADASVDALAAAIRAYYRLLRLDIERTQLVEVLDEHGIDIDLEHDPTEPPPNP